MNIQIFANCLHNCLNTAWASARITARARFKSRVFAARTETWHPQFVGSQADGDTTYLLFIRPSDRHDSRDASESDSDFDSESELVVSFPQALNRSGRIVEPSIGVSN